MPRAPLPLAMSGDGTHCLCLCLCRASMCEPARPRPRGSSFIFLLLSAVAVIPGDISRKNIGGIFIPCICALSLSPPLSPSAQLPSLPEGGLARLGWTFSLPLPLFFLTRQFCWFGSEMEFEIVFPGAVISFEWRRNHG